MKNKKGSVAAIVIIIIMVITLGVIVRMFGKNSSIPVLQSLAPAKNVQQIIIPDGWKSYTNNKHGYSIGYPADWKFYDYNDQMMREFLDDEASFTNPKGIGFSDTTIDGNKGNLMITVFTNYKSPKPGLVKDRTVPTINEWKAGIAQRPGATIGPSKFLEDEKIAGMRCAVNKIPWHLQKYCIRDDRGYLFSISSHGPMDDAIGEKIISTFKFIK